MFGPKRHGKNCKMDSCHLIFGCREIRNDVLGRACSTNGNNEIQIVGRVVVWSGTACEIHACVAFRSTICIGNEIQLVNGGGWKRLTLGQ